MRAAEAKNLEDDLQKQEQVLQNNINQLNKANQFIGNAINAGLEIRDYIQERIYQRQIQQLNTLHSLYVEQQLRKHGMDEKTLGRLSGGFKEVYQEAELLPWNAFNKKYPIKKTIRNESGWDRFVNSFVKGWHYFAKWFVETGWKLLLSIAVDVLLGCIPGVGPLLGMVARTGADVMIEVLDHAKTSAERAHLQRAINEGKSRGLDEWEEMFMWRSVMIILILGVAQREGMILEDGRQLKDLFRTRPEFMERIQDPEFLKGLWSVQSMAAESLFGETNGEINFEKVPEDVEDARSLALNMLTECLQDGTIKGIKVSYVKDWLG